MNDPNADLIGFQYVTAEGTPAAETVTVVGTPTWSEQYVTVRFSTGHETIKPAAIVRRHKEMTSDSSGVLPGTVPPSHRR